MIQVSEDSSLNGMIYHESLTIAELHGFDYVKFQIGILIIYWSIGQ